MSTRLGSLTKGPRTGGFTYFGLLFAITILGLAVAAGGVLWSATIRRDRESQLLWVGGQYQRAIASYYLAGPPGLRQLPASLADLLEDRRGPALVRHLRRLYADPMTGRGDWNLELSAEGAILGVRSRATGRPMKRARFEAGLEGFENAECYCDWAFRYVPPRSRASNAQGE
jgi:type II secretory pathway pseudopilin PulG